MERKVLFCLIVAVIMHISWAQNPRQLIRFGKRPFSADRFRNQLPYLKFPQDTYKTRTDYMEGGDVQQPIDFQHANQANDLRIRKWAVNEDTEDILDL